MGLNAVKAPLEKANFPDRRESNATSRPECAESLPPSERETPLRG